MTKKVVESASETDDETEAAPKPKPEVKQTVNKKEVIFPFFPYFYWLIMTIVCDS